MIKNWKRLCMAFLVTVFVSGAILAPGITQVFAAEQTTNQDQQTPSTDAPQGGSDEHAGHH